MVLRREKMKKLNFVFLFLLILAVGCTTDSFIVEDEYTVQGYTEIENFDSYNVEVGSGLDPVEFNSGGVTLRYDGKRSLRDEAIAKVDVSYLKDGFNTVRIGVKDTNENTFYEYSYIYVDNDKIVYPETGLNFELIRQSPANLPSEYSTYYIIETKKEISDEEAVIVLFGENEEEVPEETLESGEGRRISGSKIEIRGNLNERDGGRYEVDYTYDPDKRVWSNAGVELVNSREDDVLATLDLKELRYNGEVIIRLRKFTENSLESTDTVTVILSSEIYNSLSFKTESEIKNLGNNNVNGFLSIKVDKFEGRDSDIQTGEERYYLSVGESAIIGGHNLTLNGVGSGGEADVQVGDIEVIIPIGSTSELNGLRVTNYETFYDSKDSEGGSAVLLVRVLDPVVGDLWTEYKTVKDRVPFTLLKKQTFDLSRIDLEGLKVDEPGKYRMHVEFDDGREIRQSYYLFDVIRRIGAADYCTDGTLRKSCSVEAISYYCDSSLQLTQNCKSCGCSEGFICQITGQCIEEV